MEVLKSRVHSVDVFRSGAVVTRAADLEGKTWPDEVAIDGLPLALQDDSVRVRVVSANAEAKLPRPADVRVSLVVPEMGAPMEPPSEKEMRDAADEVSRLEAEVNRIHAEVSRLDSIQIALPEPFENRPPKPTPAAAWMGVIEWTQKAKMARVKERAKLDDELMRAREKLARLQRRDAEARSKRDGREDAVRKRVVLRLRDGGLAVPASLRVEYRVPGARWVPTYVFRMARDGRTATLGVRALVVQSSGEAWERVKLSLSTADLLRDAELPELKSLRIGRRQPPSSKRAWREPPTGMETLFEGLDRALSTMRPPPPVAPPAELAPMPPPPPAPEPQPLAEIMDGLGAEQGESDDYGAAPRGRRDAARSEEAERPMPRRALGKAGKGEAKKDAAPAAKSIATTSPAQTMARRPSAAPAPMAPGPMAGAAPGGAALGGMMDRRMADEDEAGAEEKALADDELDQVAGVTPDQALLQYGNLMMAGWSGAHARGRLRRMTLSDRLVGIAPAAAPAVARKIGEAENAARRVEHFTFPPDTIDPASSSGAFDHRYVAEGLVDVPSDGKVHNVPLFSRSAPVATTLVVVPRESDQAVRTAAMKNALDSPLLAGPAEIYLEDEFLVQSPIRTVPAGAELKIGLGIEPALKVARNVHFDEEAHGVFGGGASLKHEVVIDIASRLASRVKVEVRERVPVKDDPLEKEIEIMVPEAQPPWEEWDQGDIALIKGGRRWRFDLEPNAEKKLRFSYLVKIDSKSELVGGNRRE